MSSDPYSDLRINTGEKRLMPQTGSVYQAQDSESHCHHLDDDPSDNRPGMKRKRAAQLHKLSEKRRRHKINKRLRALQHLLPNCTKMDKASVLDDTIEYLKSLQYQLRIMSIFAAAAAALPTQMMLPIYYPPTLQCFFRMHHL